MWSLDVGQDTDRTIPTRLHELLTVQIFPEISRSSKAGIIDYLPPRVQTSPERGKNDWHYV